jgi:hypothetical protein
MSNKVVLFGASGLLLIVIALLVLILFSRVRPRRVKPGSVRVHRWRYRNY